MASPIRLLSIFENGAYDGADGMEAQFAPGAVIMQWLGKKAPGTFTPAVLKAHLMGSGGAVTGRPEYKNVRRYGGAGFFVEQHTVHFPHGHKSIRNSTTEAVLVFRLDQQTGKIVRLDEFLHAKDVAFTPRL
jgi:hypothetical protein